MTFDSDDLPVCASWWPEAMTVLKRDHDDRHASSAKRREDDRQRARKYSKRTAKARWLKQKNDPAYKAKKAAQARARYTKRKLLNA